MNEELLAGGDVNVVVRAGDTVRRPTGPWSPAVQARSPLGPDDEAAQYGFPTHRRGPRMRAICDAYGPEERVELIDRVVAMRRAGYELRRRLGGHERQPGWCEMWDAGSGETALAGIRWLEDNREELERWL